MAPLVREGQTVLQAGRLSMDGPSTLRQRLWLGCSYVAGEAGGTRWQA